MANILLVDDSRVTLKRLSILFRELGHDIYTAENGENAIDLLKVRAFDLMILDLTMPKLDGVGTLKKIREESIKSPPIVVFTADTQQRSAELCLEYGAAEVFHKPELLNSGVQDLVEKYIGVPE